MKTFTYLFVLLLILLGVSFSLLNASDVTVNYFLGSAVLPVSFLIIISMAVGAIFSYFLCFFSLLRQKAVSRGLRKKVESLEKVVSVTSINIKE